MDIKSGCWAEISLDNIGYNLKEIKKSLDSEMKICCVVKANAYGSGSVQVAKYLEKQNVDFLSVARIEEALELRKNNIKLPILCMGYIDTYMIKEAIINDVSFTVYNVNYAKEVDRLAALLNKKANVHIKIDSGMSRLGLLVSESIEPIKEIYSHQNLNIEGIYTHFAKSDEKDKTDTLEQLNKFKFVIDELNSLNINIPLKHVANSAAVLDLKEGLFNMARVGIILYGHYPSDEVNMENIKIKPCLKLKSTVTNVKIVDENIGVSYGYAYKTCEKTKIVTISIGYADGFNRIQHNPKVSINGYILDVIGRICMDQCMVKAPIDADISIGDEVIVMDNDIYQLSIEENARRNDTINYEILCMINRRVTRVYKENDKTYAVNYLLN